MRIRSLLLSAVALASLSIAGCRHETPIQRAERICLEQERAKTPKDASDTVRNLHELGAKATCSAGPALCEVAPDGAECKKFINTYN
ncbi:MAG TPA: hypothetical protein VMV18_02785 [bacterium]|nr:hypothetical protein [bacterium]